MCQLTYSNLKDKTLNALMIYFLATKGSSEKHDDGCGIICKDLRTWKTEHSAHKITNLGEILDKYILGKEPVPFHIRQATWGIEVTKENAHPFDGKHFILMHNGTLLPANGEEPKDKKKDSDSYRFLLALDNAKDEKPDSSFEEIFNHAMKDFAGKFAFIIRDKDNGNDYIIRGKTAELWFSTLTIEDKVHGYVINTSRETMLAAFYNFINIAMIHLGTKKIEMSDPKLLGLETIFLAKEKELKVIGSTEEKTPVKIHKPIVVNPNNDNSTAITPRMTDDVAKSFLSGIVKQSERVYKFLEDHSLSILDLQIIFQIFAGISLLELEKEDINAFNEFMIPKLSADGKTRKKVREALNYKTFPIDIYKKADLEYPWMLNKEQDVINAIKQYGVPF